MKKLFVVLLALCLPAWSFGQNVERQRKAEAGDASEQYYMAHCYQYGWDGAPENAAQYAIWLKKAAASGEPGAQYDLSQLYKYGAYSVPQDDAEYLRWAKKSANNGYTPACYNLGLYYENIDREEAFYWYKMDMDLHWQETMRKTSLLSTASRRWASPTILPITPHRVRTVILPRGR